MAVSLTVPDRLPNETLHQWHSRFAHENMAALHQLVCQTPNRIVVVTLDPERSTAKVAIRTQLNLEVLIPPGVAATIDPDKVLLLSYEGEKLTSSDVVIRTPS